MASKNQLLGFSTEYFAEEQKKEESKVQMHAPAWRFHEKCLEGKVAKTDRELAELDLIGWKDHPGKVKLLPGHEKLWEAECAKSKMKRSKIDHSDEKE